MKRTNSGSVAEESVSMRETEGEREKGHHSSIVFGVGYGEVLTRVEEERLHLRRDDRPLKFEQLSQQCTRALFCRGMRQEKKKPIEVTLSQFSRRHPDESSPSETLPTRN